ncbi:MAG: ABC transporter permease, partial [Thermoplasmata archaeon]
MRYAWDGLRRRPARSAATALGIGLSVALVVLLLALSSGVTQSAAELAQSSGVDLLATSANTSLLASTFPPVVGAHQLPARIEAAVPNVATASPWLIADWVLGNQSLYSRANLSPDGGSVPAGWRPTGTGIVGWIPGDNGGIEVPTVTDGTGFTASGDPHYGNGGYNGPETHEIVLDSALSSVLHAPVGSLLWAAGTTPAGPAQLSGWYANAT